MVTLVKTFTPELSKETAKLLNHFPIRPILILFRGLAALIGPCQHRCPSADTQHCHYDVPQLP
jgi:hypothetical protein